MFLSSGYMLASLSQATGPTGKYTTKAVIYTDSWCDARPTDL